MFYILNVSIILIPKYERLNVMTIRIYVRASTKDQDATRALNDLHSFANGMNDSISIDYIENESGTKLDRPVLNKLLNDANDGDTLLVESVDRLSRLTQSDFNILKGRLKDKGLKLIVADLPTTHISINTDDSITSSIMNLINDLLIDLLATMARLDNEKRIERIKQGLANSGYKPNGKKADTAKHSRIIELNRKGLTKEEIANAVGCSNMTVYRVLKSYQSI